MRCSLLILVGMSLALLPSLPACGGRQTMQGATPDTTSPGEPLKMLVAAALDVRAQWSGATLVLDTTGMRPEHASAVAQRLGVRTVRRNEVLNCVPPICRLEGADVMVWLAPPSRISADEAWVPVQVWMEGSPRRGTATAVHRLILQRHPDGEWEVRSREWGPVS